MEEIFVMARKGDGLQWDSRLSPSGAASSRHTRHGVPRWVWVLLALAFLLLLLWFMASRGGDGDTSAANAEAGDIAAAVRIAENRAGYSAIDIAETDQNGRIILTGNLPTLADRLAAEKVAVSVANVIEVDNQITTDEVERDPAVETSPVGDDALLLQRNLSREVSANPIFFATSSADLDPVSIATIERIAAMLGEAPDVKIEIGGHTDSDGDEQANLDLSANRAQTVLDELVARGVNPGQLVATGFGASEPIASNDSKEGKAKNRRIEFRVIA